MKKTFSILFTLLLLSSSCKSKPKVVDEGKIDNQVYHSNEIGWTIQIPDGWDLVDAEKGDEATRKGKEAIEKSLNTTVEVNGVKNLISFQKNKFNVFSSTSEKFGPVYRGEWAANSARLKEILYATYLDNGLPTDSSETNIEKINGVDFETYCFTIRGRQNEVIFRQLIYDALINGFALNICIMYNDEKLKNEMLSAFRSSRFK